jgi:Rod binding domain-containing protein
MGADPLPVDVRSLAALPGERALHGARSAADGGRTVEAAHEFEKLFATLLVKELRRGLPEGFFGQGAGADVYEGWLDEHLGAALSEGRGLGLRVALERQLGPTQPPEAAPTEAQP